MGKIYTADNFVKSSGTSSQFLKADGSVDSTAYQVTGGYITSLTGEVTASGAGAASATLNNASVTGKVLTGVNVAGGSISATDSILSAFGKVQNQINGLIGGSIYQSVWNASTNTPTLTTSVGTKGYYYIVNVAGSTNLNGITDWKVGDWAIYDGTAWQKVDNTDAVSSVNGYTGAVSLTTANISEVTNLYYTEGRVSANTDVAANTAARHSAVTIGTANGLSLSTQVLSLGLASTSANGALSSTDWTTFNNKQNALSGTGFVKISGSTISYDNTTYYPSSNPNGYINALTDTLATVTARGALTTGNIFTPVNGGLFFNGNGLYGSGVYGSGNDLWFNAGSSQKATLNSSGDFTANASLRSPIFYDSNDTGYYLDPASTSNLNGLTVSSTISGSVNGASRYFPTNYVGGVQTNPQVYFNYLQGLNVAMTGAWSTWSDTLWINGYSGGDVPNMCALHFLRNGQPRMSISTQTRESTSYGTYYEVLTDYNYSSRSNFSGAVYGTIFYDSNNTGYYVDPASTSNMNSISAGGYIYANNYIESGGAIYGTIFYDNNNRSYYCDPHSTSFFAGLQANSNIQSPIYYDYNNTGYYVDPASTSSLNGVVVNNISLNQNPVGSTYGAGQGGPPNSIYQTAGDNDGFRIYAESPATNRVRAIFQIEDDIETESEQWVFRNKRTYSGLDCINSVIISGGGTLTASADVVAYSDRRVKENINTIENALDKVRALRGVTYNRTDKKDKSEKVGVIAQEIQEVLPQVVHEQEDGMLGVSYGNITAVLIEAIKEQSSIIDKLIERIEKLESR